MDNALVGVANMSKKISKKSSPPSLAQIINITKMISEKQQSLSSLFPYEIQLHIASCLPASTILQYRQQSSTKNKKYDFDDIISDPQFPRLFQANNNTSSSRNTATFLAYDCARNNANLIDYDNNNNGYINEFRINMNFVFDELQDSKDTKITTYISNPEVVASCNGWLLVCRLHDEDDSLYASLRLVNPITRRCMVLPKASYELQPCTYYGMGYNSKTTGLLKVVRLRQDYNDTTKIVANVFTLVCDDEHGDDTSSTNWVVTDTENSVGLDSIRGEAVALNGALHWLVINNDKFLILRFDLDKEKFEFVPLPRTCIQLCPYLGVLDGLLCLRLWDDNSMKVWVMKEHGVEKSWTRFIVIHNLDMLQFWSMKMIIPELKYGKLWMLSQVSDDWYVDVYDPKECEWDRSVPLLERMDKNTKTTITLHHFVPSFL